MKYGSSQGIMKIRGKAGRLPPFLQDDILLMRRTLGEDSCLIAMNFSPKAAGECPVPEGSAVGLDIETGGEQASLSEGTLTLPPYAIVILQ